METNDLLIAQEKNNGVQFLTIAQFMARTTLSRPSVNRYIKQGNIPVVRFGRRVLIDIAFLETLQAKGHSAKEGQE